MAESHPMIIILFIPAGLTGLFQPYDIGFQCLFKLSLKLSSHNDVVQEVLGQLHNSTAIENVKIDTTLIPRKSLRYEGDKNQNGSHLLK